MQFKSLFRNAMFSCWNKTRSRFIKHHIVVVTITNQFDKSSMRLNANLIWAPPPPPNQRIVCGVIWIKNSISLLPLLGPRSWTRRWGQTVWHPGWSRKCCPCRCRTRAHECASRASRAAASGIHTKPHSIAAGAYWFATVCPLTQTHFRGQCTPRTAALASRMRTPTAPACHPRATSRIDPDWWTRGCTATTEAEIFDDCAATNRRDTDSISTDCDA